MKMETKLRCASTDSQIPSVFLGTFYKRTGNGTFRQPKALTQRINYPAVIPHTESKQNAFEQLIRGTASSFISSYRWSGVFVSSKLSNNVEPRFQLLIADLYTPRVIPPAAPPAFLGFWWLYRGPAFSVTSSSNNSFIIIDRYLGNYARSLPACQRFVPFNQERFFRFNSLLLSFGSIYKV